MDGGVGGGEGLEFLGVDFGDGDHHAAAVEGEEGAAHAQFALGVELGVMGDVLGDAGLLTKIQTGLPVGAGAVEDHEVDLGF